MHSVVWCTSPWKYRLLDWSAVEIIKKFLQSGFLILFYDIFLNLSFLLWHSPELTFCLYLSEHYFFLLYLPDIAVVLWYLPLHAFCFMIFFWTYRLFYDILLGLPFVLWNTLELFVYFTIKPWTYRLTYHKAFNLSFALWCPPKCAVWLREINRILCLHSGPSWSFLHKSRRLGSCRDREYARSAVRYPTWKWVI